MSKLANIRAAAIGALNSVPAQLQEFVDVVNFTELPAIALAHNTVNAGERAFGDRSQPQTREDRQGELVLHCAAQGDTEALAADAAETLAEQAEKLLLEDVTFLAELQDVWFDSQETQSSTEAGTPTATCILTMITEYQHG